MGSSPHWEWLWSGCCNSQPLQPFPGFPLRLRHWVTHRAATEPNSSKQRWSNSSFYKYLMYNFQELSTMYSIMENKKYKILQLSWSQLLTSDNLAGDKTQEKNPPLTKSRTWRYYRTTCELPLASLRAGHTSMQAKFIMFIPQWQCLCVFFYSILSQWFPLPFSPCPNLVYSKDTVIRSIDFSHILR
jgi:hypothetical protein